VLPPISKSKINPAFNSQHTPDPSAPFLQVSTAAANDQNAQTYPEVNNPPSWAGQHPLHRNFGSVCYT
jgi:hypothetical protein